MNCSQNEPLDFCRFRNPIGVIYPVTNKTLLKIGKCDMTVESADYNHEGRWICYLGSKENISTKTISFRSGFNVSIHSMYISPQQYKQTNIQLPQLDP